MDELPGIALERSDKLVSLLVWPTLLCILLARVIFAGAFPGPWFLPDEVHYLKAANQMAGDGEVLRHSLSTQGFQPGWPALIAPIMKMFEARRNAYLAAVMMASCLGSLILLPAYWLARTWLPPREAIFAGILPAVLPGPCLLGWAALTEPLYTLLQTICALLFVRAVRSGRVLHFVLCLVAGLLSLTVRPFGVCVLAAAAVGFVAFDIYAGRAKRVLILGGVPVGLLLIAYLLRWRLTGRLSITNYDEAGIARGMGGLLATAAGWRLLGMAVWRDASYLFLAGFGVMAAFALIPLMIGLRRIRALSPAEAAMWFGGITLIAGTLAMSAMMRKISGLEPIYGRYSEPLWGILAPVAVVGASMLKSRWGWATTGAIVAIGMVVSERVISGTDFTFANNAGIWVLHQLRPELGAKGMGLVALGICCLFALFVRWRVLGWLVVVLLAAGSTAMVAVDIRSTVHGLRDLRVCATGMARGIGRRPATVWVDSRLSGIAPGMDVKMQYIAWLLRYYSPAADVRFIEEGEQWVSRGDFLVTVDNLRDRKPLWSNGVLAMYCLDWTSSRSRPLLGQTPGEPGNTGLIY